jgi:D-glycero-D-manno-heptose 1,7-bisphosphate phosphatase
MTPPLRRCVFFDRDGVVNESPGDGYVLSPEAFHLNPGIVEALRLIRDRDVLAIVVTSQKCVGKGLITAETLTQIHEHMAGLLEAGGASFDAIYSHTGTGGPEDHPAKPDPGMIFAAAERFAIDLRQSWIIGDADRDIEMGIAADLAGSIRIRGDKAITVSATHLLENTAEIPKFLRLIL